MRAYLGLGANLGDRRRNIAEAVRRLEATPGIRVVRTSPLVETKPVGGPAQPDYLNAACEVDTTLSPRELLDAALAVERAIGRRRSVRWGPRVIDIDILLCDDLVVDAPDLRVPHPRMHERRFVLEPLDRIAPGARHPELGKTVRELLAHGHRSPSVFHRSARFFHISGPNFHISRPAGHMRTRKVTTIGALRKAVRRWRKAGETVGFVPTMGALHAGHASLVRRSAAQCDRTVVSIFINPKQFGPREDLSKYPRRLAADLSLCGSAGADIVFAPSVEEVYPSGFSTYVEVAGLTRGLCGASRPVHFRGVTTVCAKLFGMVQPDRAYFGLKDYQQLQVIKRMVRDLDLPLTIVDCPTVRLSDGLAMSSRNKYLTRDQRKQATVLFRALMEARRLVGSEGVRRSSAIVRAMKKIIGEAPESRVDYIEVVHPETLEPLRLVTAEAQVALAVFIGKTRLIDNMRVALKGVKADA